GSEQKRPTEEQMDAAKTLLSQCLELDPLNVRGLYNLAWILDERKDYAGAISNLNLMIQQKDKLPETERGRRFVNALINRACALAKLVTKDGGKPSPEDLGRIMSDCKAAQEEAAAYKIMDVCQQKLQSEWGEGGDMHAV